MIKEWLSQRGIYPAQVLKELITNDVIKTNSDYPIGKEQIQPNSLDLRLGTTAYRVRCSFLPENETVLDKLKLLSQHSFSIKDGAVLEPNCIYIIPLLESLDLSKLKTLGGEGLDYSRITAKANPKSSTGRLDIFTRVITDHSHRFEEIRAGYSGPLYLEVVPKTFPIRVRTGQKLNQLRIRNSDTTILDSEILTLHAEFPLLLHENGKALSLDEVKVGNGLFMSVALQGNKDQIVGYKAKKHRDLIDLDKIGHYRVQDFWDPIYAQSDDYFILEPEAFYIFASKERCRIPAEYAAEMVPYDTGSGELRTHYAGFFDSGFGCTDDGRGARAVLEVRSHDVPFLVEDGQTFFRMVFEKNSMKPESMYGQSLKSNYQGQDLKLGKHFK
ncbi:2'-deoxycytidine 5'-triphosphate deaminase [bacterium]|nr:MAG: 2'-deoxycytidine 5'-triphosphate deaminase [bacterium]